MIIIGHREVKTAAGKIRELTGAYDACTKDIADAALKIGKENGLSSEEFADRLLEKDPHIIRRLKEELK